MLTTKLRFASKRPIKTIAMTISDGFGPSQDRFERFRIVFGLFLIVSDVFGAFSDHFRMHPFKILKLQISIFPLNFNKVSFIKVDETLDV